MPQCKAKSKRTQKQCKNLTVRGKNVCRMHGGKSTGPSKGSQNAKTHGAYTTTFTPKDKEAYDSVDLDHMDDEIRRNAVLERRGFELANDKKHAEFGLKLSGDAISRARKLKMSRHEIQRSKESDDNKPLPWVD